MSPVKCMTAIITLELGAVSWAASGLQLIKTMRQYLSLKLVVLGNLTLGNHSVQTQNPGSSITTLLFFPVNNAIISPALQMLLGKLQPIDSADLLILDLSHFQILPHNIQPFANALCRQMLTRALSRPDHTNFVKFTTGFHAVWDRIPVSEPQFPRSSPCSQPGFQATSTFSYSNSYSLKTKTKKTNQLKLYFKNTFLNYQDLVACMTFSSFCSCKDVTQALVMCTRQALYH